MDASHKAAIEKFLKEISFSARREVEKAVRDALANGQLKDGDTPPVQVTLASNKFDLNVTIHKRIDL